jgi:hypothetical protein
MAKEARRKRLSPFLEVNLQNKIYTKVNNKNVLVYIISFKNTETLKIKTVTGNLTLNDLMDKPIMDINIFVDEDISPGRTLIKTYNIFYDDADENDRHMRSKDLLDIREVSILKKLFLKTGNCLNKFYHTSYSSNSFSIFIRCPSFIM